jgi:hypothetical protein
MVALAAPAFKARKSRLMDVWWRFAARVRSRREVGHADVYEIDGLAGSGASGYRLSPV